MRLAIVKYNAGNVRSVQHALRRLGAEAVWTDDPDLLRKADKVIFPGVGEASSAMAFLQQNGLDTLLQTLRQPVLGICLGLQLFCRHSEEGNTPCLGIFDAAVRRFPPTTDDRGDRLKVPHMGWNTLQGLQGPLFAGIPEESYVYFVHSFYMDMHPYAIAKSRYGVDFSAAAQHGNFYAVQFHPEKSGPVGLRLLQNFLNL